VSALRLRSGDQVGRGKLTQVDEIRRQLPGVDEIARQLYGIEFKGGVARCPHVENHAHGDRDPSLRFDKAKNRIFCASQNCFTDKGADAFDLVQNMDQVDFKSACDKLAAMAGVAISSRNPHRNGLGKNGHLASSDPRKSYATAEYVRRKMSEEGWAAVAEYLYGPVLRNVRFENPLLIDPAKGRPEKTYKWEHLRDGKWWSGDGGYTKPVYLNAICSGGKRSDCILGVEGPNKAEAAAELGIPAFSFKNISEESGKELTAFSRVVLWPDKDTPGLKLAEAAATRLGIHVRDLRMIDPPANLPEAGDIIDALAAGMDAAGVRALMDGARRIRTGPAIRAISEVPLIGSFEGIKIDWIVEEVLVAGTITALTGDAGCGKSTVATALCGSIACGMPFAGRETHQRPVLIIDKENPLPILADRFRRLRVSDGEHLRVWGGWCPDEPPDVDSPILTAWVASCNPKPVLVIDSLIAFNKGDENDAGEIRKFFSALRRLADAGATIILLHHTGKGETTKDYRGSSDIKASIDVGFHLANFGDLMMLATLRLRAWKARYSVAAEMILRYSNGTFTSDVNDRGQTVTQQLIQLLKNNPGVRTADFENISGEKGLGRDRARSFLKGGVKAGTVRLDKGQHNTQCHVWIGGDSEVEDGLF